MLNVYDLEQRAASGAAEHESAERRSERSALTLRAPQTTEVGRRTSLGVTGLRSRLTAAWSLPAKLRPLLP